MSEKDCFHKNSLLIKLDLLIPFLLLIYFYYSRPMTGCLVLF